MILHLLRMRRNVNWNVFNDRKNVRKTASWRGDYGSRARKLDIPNSNPPFSVSNIGQVRSFHVALVHPATGIRTWQCIVVGIWQRIAFAQ